MFPDRAWSTAVRRNMGSGMQHPILSFFPAIQLARNIELGEWAIGAPAETVAWRPEPFRELARTLLESAVRREFRHPALLWHRERGFDGSVPTDDEARAIQAAVRFAVLDNNDQVSRDHNTGHYLATSENGVFYRQPIDEVGRSVAHEEGGALKSALIGGWRIGERPVSLPDATQAIIRPVAISQCLAAAVYAAVLAKGRAAQRIALAIEWHAIALANPKAVTLQQRVIALKDWLRSTVGRKQFRNLCESTSQIVRRLHSCTPRFAPVGGLPLVTDRACRSTSPVQTQGANETGDAERA